MVNYKDTLNILKTDFEMKANLNVKEPLTQEKWDSENIYQSLLAQNKKNKQWILHDGPPYANGDIHVGHALNKIIKDVIVRYMSMQGYYSHYIPGWDTHGLPIEHALLKMGINKDPNLTVGQKRDNCQKFATEQIEKQKAQFKRLGLLTDFRSIYRTFDREYEQRQLELFLKMVDLKLIFQDFKPVYWSWSSQTALADAEIEYGDAKSPSIYVSFIVSDGKNVLQVGDKIVIWTTTPWTIPANLAIAVNPKLEYVRVQINKAIYVVAKELLPKIAEKLNWEGYKIISSFGGEKLEHVTYQHPLYKRNSPIILATYVSKDDGTGLVHNAPGFGEDDYLACKKYGIAPFCPIDKLGKFTKEVEDDDITGIFYDDANKIITEKLKKADALLRLDFFVHSVANDWRTKKPVIYRATKQWFIDIKKIQNDLNTALDAVKFKNESSRSHIHDMIKNRTEWCISRQRVWGVPIPIIFDENDQPILDHDLIKHVIDILSSEGTNVWFDKPVSYFLTPKYQDKQCRKETDIMDVWFDSGSSWTVLKSTGLEYPADLYFEGNDQYRGWFNSSLINAVIDNKQAPYKMLLSHGFVLDEQGRKMSKSVGNVIDPLKICEKFGADVLRIWAVSSNYQEDVRISDNIVNQCAEIYRRIRNTLFKFCLANLSDFNFIKDQCDSFSDEDKYILCQLTENIEKVHNAYREYDFMTIIKVINNHVIELSSWYFDLIKDTLYCENANHPARRAIQTVLHHVLLSYLKLLAPIIPHTAEEVYACWSLPHKQSSIALESYKPAEIKTFNIDKSKWEYFFKLKGLVYTELEKIRINKEINKNNQALVEISFSNENKFDEKNLARFLNVALVKFNIISGNEIQIKVSNANLLRCERCWNYFDSSKMADEHLCVRCSEVIKNINN